jgi:uncharacterized protein YoaH (UPF0181 family)
MIWTWLVGLASGISIALVATSLKAKNITTRIGVVAVFGVTIVINA